MLSDLYLLELYYDAPQTACFYEELSRRYGLEQLQKAVQAGYLIARRLHCGPDCGRHLLWLSDKGRRHAQNSPV